VQQITDRRAARGGPPRGERRAAARGGSACEFAGSSARASTSPSVITVERHLPSAGRRPGRRGCAPG
jgi:hypothetical protein